MRTDMMQRAKSRPTEPHDVAAGDGGVREPSWWRRVWQRLMPAPSAELVLAQLNRQLAVLEEARTELEVGWVQGGWWTVSSSDGSPRLVTGYAAAGGNPDHVDGVCLVGALVRAGSHRPDARSDVGRAVDAVYDALWASRGPRTCAARATDSSPSSMRKNARSSWITSAAWATRPIAADRGGDRRARSVRPKFLLLHRCRPAHSYSGCEATRARPC